MLSLSILNIEPRSPTPFCQWSTMRRLLFGLEASMHSPSTGRIATPTRSQVLCRAVGLIQIPCDNLSRYCVSLTRSFAFRRINGHSHCSWSDSNPSVVDADVVLELGGLEISKDIDMVWIRIWFCQALSIPFHSSQQILLSILETLHNIGRVGMYTSSAPSRIDVPGSISAFRGVRVKDLG